MERIYDCDPAKRAKLLQDRHFDLRDMAQVFRDAHRLDFIDDRRDYGEERRVSVGYASGQIFTVVYTLRGPVTWLVTAWQANRKERDRYAKR